MSEVTITERPSGNLFIREVRLPKKGDSIPGHTHQYDHTTFFMSGSVLMKVHTREGVDEWEIDAPFDLNIAKDARHEMTALTDDVYFCCVFPHRNYQGEVTQEAMTRNAYL